MCNQHFIKTVLFSASFIFSSSLFAYNTLPQQSNFDLAIFNTGKREYVQFSIENDMNTEFFYYLGGSKNTIDRAVVRTFNFPEGTELYFWENGKGKLWLKIEATMNKQAFQLSKLISH